MEEFFLLGVSPVFEAIRLKQLDVARQLINVRFDFSKGSEIEESTPLCAAIKNGHADVAETLINAGARRDIVHLTYKEPLLVAMIRYDCFESTLANLLFEKGADPNERFERDTESCATDEKNYPNHQIWLAIQSAEKKEEDEKKKQRDDEDSESVQQHSLKSDKDNQPANKEDGRAHDSESDTDDDE